MASETENEFPSELTDKLANFHKQLGAVKELIENVVSINHEMLHKKMTPVDRAMFDLVMAYALNSLYWMYLNTKGENPKENIVKKELERIRSYMNKVKEIVDRAKAPRLDTGAAHRFVRGALWSAKNKNKKETETNEENGEGSEVEEETEDSKEEVQKNIKRKAEAESREDEKGKKMKKDFHGRKKEKRYN